MSVVAVQDQPRSHSGRASRRSLQAFEPIALEATRVAALACQRWIGKGDPHGADRAATEAMRAVLDAAPGSGTVIVGEGEKDRAPMLFGGERLGSAGGPEFDIAVDPLECTKLCARGLPGALATIAFAPAGTMPSLQASFYMEKLVGPPELIDHIAIGDPPEANVRRASAALSKSVSRLRVMVLDKPRHERLVGRLRATGAEVITPPDGDVAGALAALLPAGGADLLMGIGGTPEGIMTACAARALGGFMQARLAPQRADEADAVAAARLSTERVYELGELAGEGSLFVATGVSGGELLRRPWLVRGRWHTDSAMIANGSVRCVIEAAEG